jgi:hypothetical protein
MYIFPNSEEHERGNGWERERKRGGRKIGERLNQF